MSHLDGRWRRQSLVYFGKPEDSSANVAVVPRAAIVLRFDLWDRAPLTSLERVLTGPRTFRGLALSHGFCGS